MYFRKGRSVRALDSGRGGGRSGRNIEAEISAGFPCAAGKGIQFFFFCFNLFSCPQLTSTVRSFFK